MTNYAFGSEATCTLASLKHAPSPRSVSVSGTSAVPVALFRVLRRQMPFGRLTVPGRIDGATVSLPKGLWRRNTRNNMTGTALVPDTLTDIGAGACFNDARVQVASLANA